MAVYAKCPEGVDPDWSPYVTPGKEYLVEREKGKGFNTTCEAGPLFCLWAGCLHRSNNRSLNWQRIERED